MLFVRLAIERLGQHVGRVVDARDMLKADEARVDGLLDLVEVPHEVLARRAHETPLDEVDRHATVRVDRDGALVEAEVLEDDAVVGDLAGYLGNGKELSRARGVADAGLALGLSGGGVAEDADDRAAGGAVGVHAAAVVCVDVHLDRVAWVGAVLVATEDQAAFARRLEVDRHALQRLPVHASRIVREAGENGDGERDVAADAGGVVEAPQELGARGKEWKPYLCACRCPAAGTASC